MSNPSRSPGRRIGRAVAIAVTAVALVGALGLAVRPSLFSGMAAMTGLTSTKPDGEESAATTDAQAGTPLHGKRFFGVSVPQGADGNAQVAQFTAAVGVAPTLQSFFQSFNDQFNSTALKQTADAGRLPLIAWEPWDHRNPTANPFPLQAIAAGQFDAYLRAQAASFAAFKTPLVIRFAHEMNGGWYPWGQRVNGNTGADYIAAYRHVHDVVTAAGASNVVWMWTPNFLNGRAAQIPLSTLYPGDDVVDWVGVDGYFMFQHETFANLFTTTMAQLHSVAPDKPILLAETAVGRTPNRIAQINDLVHAVSTTPRVIGFVWSEFPGQRASWPVGDDPAAAAALGEGVRSGPFGATPEAAIRK